MIKRPVTQLSYEGWCHRSFFAAPRKSEYGIIKWIQKETMATIFRRFIIHTERISLKQI